MRKTSYLALVAAAGLFGATVAPATAADLGGGCCADLEERVAELEATTARKGNRVVSLQIYGQVNKALMYFDNGDDSDTFVVDNDGSTSRFGFKGSAKIKPGMTAGYTMEVDLYGDSNSDEVTVTNDEGAPSTGELRIRVNEVYIESEQLGRVTLGQGSSASDGTSEVVLANSLSNVSLNMGGKIAVAAGGSLDAFANGLDGMGRVDRVRYDSPSIYGFVLSASWGENDYYDVALRFKKEFNSIRIAAAASYVASDELAFSTGAVPARLNNEFTQVSGSISALHVPTGLYVAGSAGEKDFDNDAVTDPSFWYVQGGIEKRFFSYGSTTLYVEYGEYEDFKDTLAGASGSKAERFGLGIVQSIDSAAMDLYAQAQFWDFEHGNVSETVRADEGELTTIMVGSRIKF
jgi:predicted porin